MSLVILIRSGGDNGGRDVSDSDITSFWTPGGLDGSHAPTISVVGPQVAERVVLWHFLS